MIPALTGASEALTRKDWKSIGGESNTFWGTPNRGTVMLPWTPTPRTRR